MITQIKNQITQINTYLIAALIFTIFALNAMADSQFIYDSRGKRDPFVSLVSKDGKYWIGVEVEAQPDEQLSLEGIVTGQGPVSYAIINGQILEVGATVSDYTLIRINPTSVDLEGKGKKITIKLREEDLIE